MPAEEGVHQPADLLGQLAQLVHADVGQPHDHLRAFSPHLRDDRLQRRGVGGEGQVPDIGRVGRGGGGRRRQPDDPDLHAVDLVDHVRQREVGQFTGRRVADVGRQIGVLAGGDALVQHVPPEVEFVVANRRGIVAHRIHQLHHRFALEPGGDRRAGPVVAAAEEQHRGRVVALVLQPAGVEVGRAAQRLAGPVGRGRLNPAVLVGGVEDRDRHRPGLGGDRPDPTEDQAQTQQQENGHPAGGARCEHGAISWAKGV